MINPWQIELDEDLYGWKQLFPWGEWKHPEFGMLNLNQEFFEDIVRNLNDNVRGQVLPIDSEHEQDKAGAKGYILEAQIRPRKGLWIKPHWTEYGKSLLNDKRFLYFSPTYRKEWVHPQTGVKYKNVLLGGALTTLPFLNGMESIVNLNEVLNGLLNGWQQEIKLSEGVEFSQKDFKKPYWGFRVEYPEVFSSETLKEKQIAPGVTIRVGNKEGEDSLTVQNYLFDREKFSLAEAQKWLQDNNIKSMDMAEPEKQDPEDSYENVLAGLNKYLEKSLASLKGKKGVKVTRAMATMMKKLLDGYIPAGEIKNKESEEESMSDNEKKNTVEFAELNELKTKLEATEKALAEKEAKAQAERDSQAQMLAELQADKRAMYVDAQVQKMVGNDIIKAGETAAPAEVFAILAEVSDRQNITLAEGAEKMDLLKKVVEMMEKSCHAVNLAEKPKGSAQDDPAKKDEKKDEVDEKDIPCGELIQKFADENKISYNEATRKLREIGKLGRDEFKPHESREK